MRGTPLGGTIPEGGANDESDGTQDHTNCTRGTGRRAEKSLKETIPEGGAGDESEGIQGHKNFTRGTGKRARKPQNETVSESGTKGNRSDVFTANARQGSAHQSCARGKIAV